MTAIVEAATEHFVESGYRNTTIGQIASDIGVRSSAIHWYFPTKSDLFAASLRSVIEEGFRAVERQGPASPQAELIGFLTDRQPYRLLHLDSHDLLGDYEAVYQVHEELHTWLDSRLMQAVAARLPADTDLGLATDVGHILLEGVLSTNKQGHSVEEVIRFVVDALVGAAQ